MNTNQQWEGPGKPIEVEYMLLQFSSNQIVQMVISDLLVGPTSLRVELKCATIQYGAQCVMTSGVMLMHRWSADSLVFPQQARTGRF